MLLLPLLLAARVSLSLSLSPYVCVCAYMCLSA